VVEILAPLLEPLSVMLVLNDHVVSVSSAHAACASAPIITATYPNLFIEELTL
jgi:hypothetical protein